jgi:hypothetical protein
VPPCAFALVFAGLGDCDTAFHHLDRAYSLRDVVLITLPNAHWWDPLRSDRRFDSLLRRIGFFEDRTAGR